MTEKIKGILGQMRYGVIPKHRHDHELLRFFADRIEEAVANCNQLKTREALEAVVKVGYPHNFQHEAQHIRGYCYEITEAIRQSFAALDAPPRNCDVGTAEEQAERFEEFCLCHWGTNDTSGENCRHCPLSLFNCKLEWAQLPYEGEHTKKGESNA